MAEYLSNSDETKIILPRIKWIYLLVSFSFILFSGRLWYLQIQKGEELRNFSERNHIREIKFQAPRGVIYDRQGRILVNNRVGFEVVIQSQYVRDWDQVFDVLEKAIANNDPQFRAKLQKKRVQSGRYSTIRVKDNLNLEEAFRVKRIIPFISGIEIREKIVRQYQLGSNGSQLFGYVGEISKQQLEAMKEKYPDKQYEMDDIIGKFGLEELLESVLHGENGFQMIQVDALGRELRSTDASIFVLRDLRNKPARSGKSVQLTIDMDIQKAAWSAFISQEKIGSAVVLNRDGEVLAWVSVPAFDPNAFIGGIDPKTWKELIQNPRRPLRNKVIQDFFPPGSTFKPFVALAALNQGVIKPNTIVSCPGVLYFGNRPFHDHKKEGFGSLNVVEALERSSNVFFYKMGIALGIDNMYANIAPFGFGEATGIELPRESQGIMPSAEWKRLTRNEPWHPGENLSVAIGQGMVLATPLQMAVAYLAIGRNGILVRPFVVRKIFEGDQEKIYRNAEVKRVLTHIKSDYFEIVKEGLRRVVNGSSGTARAQVRLEGVSIAGKTGTAQVRGFASSEIYQKCELRPFEQRHHGWFVGYAPSDDPEIVVAVLAEHSCAGSRGAGPIAREIFKAYFDKYHPEMAIKIPSGVPAVAQPPSQTGTDE